MSDKNTIIDSALSDINNSSLTELEKLNMTKNIQALRDKQLNIMITGATGCGKSSTINALFNEEVAKVGVGVDPETVDISKYDLKNMILWDSPGLGDGRDADEKHAKNIIHKLQEVDKNGNALIDLVLVILDGSTRDLGTSFDLINNVIIPNLGHNPASRILIAINQCDVAMKGKYWNEKDNKPEKELEEFLNDKVLSVKRRIKESTSVDVEPIYYSAGYKDKDKKQNPYNLAKLFYYIIQHTPTKKRLIYIDNISKNKNNWKANDRNYSKEIQKSFWESVVETASDGADIGGRIGSILGTPGEAFGRAVGATVGGAIGFVSSVGSSIGSFVSGLFDW